MGQRSVIDVSPSRRVAGASLDLVVPATPRDALPRPSAGSFSGAARGSASRHTESVPSPTRTLIYQPAYARRRVIFCGGDRSAFLTRAERTLPAPSVTAFEYVIESIQELATARGHKLGEPARDGRYDVAIECSICEQWINISLEYERNGGGSDRGITGDALMACPGKPHRPAERRDENWPSSALANATVRNA